MKIVGLILVVMFFTGCGTIKGIYKDGKLTGVKATGNCDGGFKRNADGSTEVWINNKIEIIPPGLVQNY